MVMRSDATPKPKPSPKQSAARGGASPSTAARQKASDVLSGVDFSGGLADPTEKGMAPIWWGGFNGSGRPNPRQADSDKFLSRDEAYAKVWEWYGTPEFNKWGDYLVQLGLIDEEDNRNPNALAEKWYDAVDASANLTASGKKVKPWDAMRLISGSAAKNRAARDGSGGGGKAGKITSTTRSVNLTDPATAKALVNDVLSRQLGRAATDEEVRAFTDVLHNAQKANPSVTTETRNYDASGNYTSSTSSSGGLDAAGANQLLTDRAMQMPEYGALQAGTTYINAFEQAIQSPVPGGGR